jgi:ornithine carbamoyltransferase
MSGLNGRDFLSLTDLSAAEVEGLLELAQALKTRELIPNCQKVLGLLFYKASTRTRVSFSVAMYQLGGQVIDLNPKVTQVGRGEPLADTARVLDRYLDVVAIRTFAQADLDAFAHYAKIPVVNALTDLAHPCQALADLLTLRECFGDIRGTTVTYVGDGNNVAHSLMLCCALLGVNVRVATPPGFEPHLQVVEKARQLAGDRAKVELLNDPIAAVKGVQAIYTDVWASMGQEAEARDRIPVFQPYQVNDDLIAHADSQVILLHCLPAHRGEEITDEAIEGPHSRVWDQAENRMHVQKALLASILGAV